MTNLQKEISKNGILNIRDYINFFKVFKQIIGADLVHIHSGNWLLRIYGIGKSELREEIKNRTGNPLVTHNGFLDIAIIHGLLGFILLVYFIYKNLISLIRNRNNKYFGLGLVILFCTIVMIFF